MPPTSGTEQRAPGSFSAFTAPSTQTSTQSSIQRPSLRRVDSSNSDSESPPLVANRTQNVQAQRVPAAFTTSHPNASTNSLQNFSRPTAPHTTSDSTLRTVSPVTAPINTLQVDFSKSHTRKHSNSQGFFEPTLPTAATISPTFGGTESVMPNPNLSASQIAAQAAMQHQGLHMRQRSQTLPTDNTPQVQPRPRRGLVSPPMLSLTEASGERQNGFGSLSSQGGQIYRNGLLGGTHSAAATAANVVFQRSPQTSPVLPPSEYSPVSKDAEKPAKVEKSSKVKLFSRPGKISTKDTKEKPLPSPSRLHLLQKSNMSTASLSDSIISGASSMYSMANSSSATIRPVDAPPEKEKEKDKEKKHHFLSRQKHKLTSKDDHHLPLSSAASNSRPVDPNAPSSLYNFSLPPSPGPTATSFAKSMSGLDLRHGGRALREKKKEEKAAAGSESVLGVIDGTSPWVIEGPSSVGSAAGTTLFGPPGNIYGVDTQELARYGLNNMTADDAWPYLRAKLLIIFEGEDLRLPVEDFNKLVTTHLQRCIQRRAPNLVVEDLRDLLTTGFNSLDQTLRRTPDERLIPHLVELWRFTFTSILPYMQAVFLPLDLEFSGHGPLMTQDQALSFWGALPTSSPSKSKNNSSGAASNVPASHVLEVRRIVLTAYRDTVILPRFETLKTLFSRLSLESINLAHLPPPPSLSDNLSSSPDSFNRPSTAMSLDPSLGSYSSQSTTLLGGAESSGVRSRAISNVSYGSDGGPLRGISSTDASMPPPARPFTPSSSHPGSLGIGMTFNNATGAMGTSGMRALERERSEREREVNAIESKHVTETVGRMLQCVSVLASVGSVGGLGGASGLVGGAGMGSGGTVGEWYDEDSQRKMEELCRNLKLNWLGRGRMGRNRRGLVGAKVRTTGGEGLGVSML